MSDSGPIRKRCKRYDVPGQAHYLTFSCYHQQAFLSRDRTRDWLLSALETARLRRPFDLWGFVIMPEHVHLILLPRSGSRVSHILSSIKQPIAKRAVHWLKKNQPAGLRLLEDRQPDGTACYRLWQRGGGYDRNLWSVQEVREKIEYAHANPVRRGLVSHPRDWPWSSWRAWHDGGNGPIRIDRETLPREWH